jgi:hypothetical protein
LNGRYPLVELITILKRRKMTCMEDDLNGREEDLKSWKQGKLDF